MFLYELFPELHEQRQDWSEQKTEEARPPEASSVIKQQIAARHMITGF